MYRYNRCKALFHAGAAQGILAQVCRRHRQSDVRCSHSIWVENISCHQPGICLRGWKVGPGIRVNQQTCDGHCQIVVWPLSFRAVCIALMHRAQQSVMTVLASTMQMSQFCADLSCAALNWTRPGVSACPLMRSQARPRKKPPRTPVMVRPRTYIKLLRLSCDLRSHSCTLPCLAGAWQVISAMAMIGSWH